VPPKELDIGKTWIRLLVWFSLGATTLCFGAGAPMRLSASAGIVTLVLLVVQFVVAWRTYRRHRLARAGQCDVCGYDRRGLAQGAPCPECGTHPASTTK